MITDFCKLTFANSYAVLIKHFNMGYFRGYSKYDICLLEACFLKIRQVGGRRVVAKGIIYAMSTVVPGLVKLGKTGSDSFQSRMYNLESNGYKNVTGLKREFAIEVEDYDEKETLLDDIFSRSRVAGTELFALDINLVIQLLASFEGDQIYPPVQEETKEQTFEKATVERTERRNAQMVPDGVYSASRKQKKNDNKTIKAEMTVEDGVFIIKRRQMVSPTETSGVSSGIVKLRNETIDVDGVVQVDVELASPSAAGEYVFGTSCNGWATWKNKHGEYIDKYRD